MPPSGTTTGDSGGDTGGDTGVPFEGGEQIEFVATTGDDGQPCRGTDRCTLFMSFNAERQLQIRVTRNGAQLDQAQVRWEVTKNKNNSLAIGAKTTFTIADGTTTNTAKQVAQQEAQYEVKAWLEGSEATPVYYDIVVTPKGQVPLIVSYGYDGARQFQAVTTFLFKWQSPQQKVACADIDPTDLPAADVSSPPKGLGQSASFPQLPDLQEEVQQIYTVVGIGKDQNGPAVVWGCDDEQAIVNYTSSVNLVIPLADLPPTWKGRYDVTTRFDLVSALPDDAELIVDTILGFFTDPGGQILTLLCQFAGDINPIDDLCGFVFVEPTNPCNDDQCFESAGIAIKSLIEGILQGLLEDNVGGDILNTGADIANILQDLELVATFDLKSEPNPIDGTFTEEQTESIWHSVTYRWTLGTDCQPQDKNCGKHTFSIGAFQDGSINGNFSGMVEYDGNDNFIHINEHPLDIRYGALLNFIIKNEILPRIAGDGSQGVKVDTYAEFLKSLIGGYECLAWELDPQIDMTCCEQFANDLTGSNTGIGADIAEAACVAGVPILEDQLEKLLTDLDLDSGEGGFTLQTAVGCQTFDVDGNQTIDTWGSLDTPCHWSTQLGIGDPIDNDFWAVEQQ